MNEQLKSQTELAVFTIDEFGRLIIHDAELLNSISGADAVFYPMDDNTACHSNGACGNAACANARC